MRFRSTLKEPYSEKALRRMMSWVAKQLGYPLKELRRVDFCYTSQYWSGRWYQTQRRMSVRLGKHEHTKPRERTRFGITTTVADAWETLILVTAHELAHAEDYRSGKTNERSAEAQSARVLRTFQEQRAELVPAWLEAPRAAKPAKEKPTLRERRAQQACRNLERWERRAKAAANRVKAWRKKVSYYERVAAVADARKAE